MSRGPGRVARSIRSAFYAEPQRVFSTADLIALAYDDGKVTTARRHAVSRAAKKVISRMNWTCERTEGSGRPVLYRREVLVNTCAPRETFEAQDHG